MLAVSRSGYEQLAQYKNELETAFENEKARLYGEFEVQKKEAVLERERQMAELARERNRLEGLAALREAELLKKFEGDRLGLQEAWEKKQKEWLAEHQAALQEAEAALTRKIKESEETLAGRQEAEVRDLFRPGGGGGGPTNWSTS